MSTALLLLPLFLGAASAGEPDSSLLRWADQDGDGHLDVLSVAPSGELRLLLGRGDGRFTDATETSGLNTCGAAADALWVDLDGDGRLDVVALGTGGDLRLLRAGAGPVFLDVTETSGLAGTGGVRRVRGLDLDADGLADLELYGAGGVRVFRGLGDMVFGELDLGLSSPAPGAVWFGSASKRPDGPAASAPATAGAARAGGTGWTGLRATRGSGGLGSASGGIEAATGGVAVLANALVDQGGSGGLRASSVPTLGQLYPLGNDFYVEAGTGRIGLGTTAPLYDLDVRGVLRATDTIVSSKTAGAPFQVASAALNANLNADLLDGLDATAFSQFGALVDTAELADGAVTAAKLQSQTITDAEVSPTAAIQGSKIVADFSGQTVLADAIQFPDGSSLSTTAPATPVVGTFDIPGFSLSCSPGGSVVIGYEQELELNQGRYITVRKPIDCATPLLFSFYMAQAQQDFEVRVGDLRIEIRGLVQSLSQRETPDLGLHEEVVFDVGMGFVRWTWLSTGDQATGPAPYTMSSSASGDDLRFELLAGPSSVPSAGYDPALQLDQQPDVVTGVERFLLTRPADALFVRTVAAFTPSTVTIDASADGQPGSPVVLRHFFTSFDSSIAPAANCERLVSLPDGTLACVLRVRPNAGLMTYEPGSPNEVQVAW